MLRTELAPFKRLKMDSSEDRKLEAAEDGKNMSCGTLAIEKCEDSVQKQESIVLKAEDSGEKNVFKMPVLIGPRLQPKNLPTPVKMAPCIPVDVKKEDLTTEKFTLVYDEPNWGGVPSEKYSLEVLKFGSIVATIDLSGKSYYSLGRLTNNDVVLEHPTSSRFHAVLQFRKQSDDKTEGASEKRPMGFYLYDLESTHGTFLNKNRLGPKIYYKVNVGHMFKFGNSTRVYILQGPAEDQEDESEFTVTELKEMRKLQEEKMRQAKEAEELRLRKLEEEREEAERQKGVDWGIAEDAVEDGITENPFALEAATLNENMYLTDPKKTLRGWFEREGYELEYLVEEKGPAKFSCRIQLPLDMRTGEKVFAEATVKGKKKEAVAACALEACKMLDRHGVLRQANHESRKKKSRDWEKDDFYDSDEDTFLDRTGAIEKKRQQRLEKAGKGPQGNVDTYQTLLEKHSEHVRQMRKLEAEIEVLTAQQGDGEKDAEVDPLEAFMHSLQGGNKSSGKQSRSRMKMRLIQMRQEEVRLKKLLNRVKPTDLPSLSSTLDAKKTAGTARAQNMLKQYGLTKIVKAKLPVIDTEMPEINTAKTDTNTEKMDEVTVVEKSGNEAEDEQPEPSEIKSEVDQLATSESEANVAAAEDQTTENAAAVPQRRRKSENKTTRKQHKQKKFEYDESDPNYALWLPPTDQTGDGTTKLNAKYGY